MENLQGNVAANFDGTDEDPCNVAAQEIDWTSEGTLEKAETLADIIVGTDVLFSEDMVLPLVRTMHARSRKETVVYILVQVRCQQAHVAMFGEGSDGDWSEETDEGKKLTKGHAHRAFKSVRRIPLWGEEGEEHVLSGKLGACAKALQCQLWRLSRPRSKVQDK